MAVGYCRVADHEVGSHPYLCPFCRMDIKWMRLSKPEISIKTRQAYPQSILPLPSKETLLHIPSWKISQALLFLLYCLNKGPWLARLFPGSCYVFATQYNKEPALTIRCLMLQIAECPLEAWGFPGRAQSCYTFYKEWNSCSKTHGHA